MWDTNSFHYMISRIARLFSQTGVVFPFSASALGLNAKMIFLFAGIIISTPIGKWIADKFRKLTGPYTEGKKAFAVAYDAVMIGVFIICIIFLVGETFNPFIYFRF